MKYKGKYGIIAPMKIEAEHIIAAMENAYTETVGGIEFTVGKLRMENEGGEFGEADAVVAVCGIGKVFAAMCAQTMIVKYAPDKIINTGVAGTLSPDIGIGDVVLASDWTDQDFFIWTATGTSDFAGNGFTYQINSMVTKYSDMFHLANNETEGNVSFRLREDGDHDEEANFDYTFNALCWFWNTEE